MKSATPKSRKETNRLRFLSHFSLFYSIDSLNSRPRKFRKMKKCLEGPHVENFISGVFQLKSSVALPKIRKLNSKKLSEFLSLKTIIKGLSAALSFHFLWKRVHPRKKPNTWDVPTAPKICTPHLQFMENVRHYSSTISFPSLPPTQPTSGWNAKVFGIELGLKRSFPCCLQNFESSLQNFESSFVRHRVFDFYVNRLKWFRCFLWTVFKYVIC